MVSAPSSETCTAQDGRIARGLRTHESIVSAYESLIARAAVPPTGAELAARAGVSARSVFTHFGDMDGVLRAALKRGFAWVEETHVGISADLPLEERVVRFARRQAEILERTAPLYRMYRTVRQRGKSKSSPELNEVLVAIDRMRRRYVESLFGREFEGREQGDRQELVEALLVSTSWGAWEALRFGQQLEAPRAEQVMARVLRASFCPQANTRAT